MSVSHSAHLTTVVHYHCWQAENEMEPAAVIWSQPRYKWQWLLAVGQYKWQWLLAGGEWDGASLGTNDNHCWQAGNGTDPASVQMTTTAGRWGMRRSQPRYKWQSLLAGGEYKW